jgi:copper chaperone
MERVTLAISDMSCGHCVGAVTKALRDLPGVKVEKVSIGSAVLAVDPAVTPVDAVARAVEDAGYPAHVESP